MASSSIDSGNVVTKFQKKVRREYVREGRYGPFIGNDQNSVIQTNRDLKKVSLPLVAKLSGGGVRGSTQLSGSEQPLANFAQTLQPTYHRQGVLVDNEENGLLVEFGNKKQLSDALIKLLNNEIIAKQYGQKGREKLSKFSSLNSCKKFEELCTSVIYNFKKKD